MGTYRVSLFSANLLPGTVQTVEDSPSLDINAQTRPARELRQDEESEFVATDLPEDKKFKPKDVKYNPNYDLIGGGGFSDIYKAVMKLKGKYTVVALKKARGGLPLTARDLSELNKEANILLAIPSHEHVVTIVGVCCDRREYAIILEFIDGGDLKLLLCPTENSDSYLDGWSNRLDMARQIADGMVHIHSLCPPVIHRDLKPANVLVKKSSSQYCCKITDFGLAKMRNASCQVTKRNVSSGLNDAGTLAYVAPERFGIEHLDEKQATKLDVYSFGVILWQFRERKIPFDEEIGHVILANVKEGVPFNSPKCWCPEGYADLTDRCCSLKPADRPPFSGISSILHSFLAQVSEIPI
jgi:serine/threonine protein kinase